MGDVDLNEPTLPTDADNEDEEEGDMSPMELTMPSKDGSEDEEGGDDSMPGDQDDSMTGDLNQSNAGGGGLDTTGLTDKQIEDGQAYLDSMKKQNGNQGGGSPQIPMESRFNFKHIIDEVFGEVEKENVFTKGHTIRQEKEAEEILDPFSPRR